MSIKNLISSEAWEMLNRKDLKDEDLKEFGYLVVCDTCETVFLKTTLDVIRKEVKEGTWNIPTLWYIKAGRHWITAHPNCLHEINVYMVYPTATKAKVLIKGSYGLSEDWQRQVGFPVLDETKKSLLMELANLERRLTPKKIGKPRYHRRKPKR